MKCTFFTFVLIVVHSNYSILASYYNQFDDTILYNVKWPGKNEKLLENINPANTIIGVTDRQEKYMCSLPELIQPENDSESSYSGPNPIELLRPLFSQSTCSYRLESYWTYEICHGKFVKQYHEERDGKKLKKQEYFLGRWDLTMQNDLNKQLENADNSVHSIKTKKIEGMDIPYLQLNYTGGTLCDLNEKPRQTNVLYMCVEHGRSDIYSIKEISTCQYEAIVFTPLLCSHPLYKPKNSGENDINCMPLEDTADKPFSLVKMETESVKLKRDFIIDDDQVLKKVFAVFSFDKTDGEEGEARLHVQFHPIDMLSNTNTGSQLEAAKSRVPTKMTTDVTNFLSGDSCLQGDLDFWKFEFCYGKHVNQFHDEPSGTRITIELGKFDLKEHKAWLQNNPSKKPNRKGNTVSNFYSRGSFCDKANILRETEVRFVCVEKNVSPSSIILYLEEPQTCKYVLFVESPIICKLIPTMDEFGMFKRELKTAENEDEHDEL